MPIKTVLMSGKTKGVCGASAHKHLHRTNLWHPDQPGLCPRYLLHLDWPTKMDALPLTQGLVDRRKVSEPCDTGVTLGERWGEGD